MSELYHYSKVNVLAAQWALLFLGLQLSGPSLRASCFLLDGHELQVSVINAVMLSFLRPQSSTICLPIALLYSHSRAVLKHVLLVDIIVNTQDLNISPAL